MAKTFQELYTEGLQLADMTSGDGYALAKTLMKSGINESYAEIAGIRDWKTLENSTTVTSVAGTEEYTPVYGASAPRIRRIQSVIDQTNNRALNEVRREIFEQSYPYVNTSTDRGEPTLWYISGYSSDRDVKLKFYKVPDAEYTFKVTYYEEPYSLISDDSIPRIPDQFHYGLVYLGLAKYFEYEKDPIANYYRSLHEQFKEKILTIEYGESDEMPSIMPLTVNNQGYVIGKIGRIYN